jgi:molecular chaperone DnaK (HSP70)
VDVEATSDREKRPGVQLAPGQPANVIVAPKVLTNIKVQIGPVSVACTVGHLLVEAEDEALDAHTQRTRRRTTYAIDAVPDTPVALEAVQQVLTFREGLSSRALLLRNANRTPVSLASVDVPIGYSVTPRNGAVPAAGGTAPGELALNVTRRWEVALCSETATLTVTPTACPPLCVLLHCPQPPPVRIQPTAIIGIDFGTAYTSVACREVRGHQCPDDVKFLCPPGSGEARFPTRIYVSKDGRYARFGDDATHAFSERPGGFLFREIKMLLRGDSTDPKVHPEKLRVDALNWVHNAYGEGWRLHLVTLYLRWVLDYIVTPTIGRDAYCEFIFTLPVLDFGIGDAVVYNEQRSAMEECVRRAGFPPERVQFAFEPVAVAIALLHPRDDGWPKLGSAHYPVSSGRMIAVLDSGGGTTDAALMEVSVDDTAKLSMRVVGCLGVDSEMGTFGGEMVTDELIETLLRPAQAGLRQGMFQGDLSLENALGLPERCEEVGIEERDLVERLKWQLAEAANSMITLPNGRLKLSGSLLNHLISGYLLTLAESLVAHMLDKTVPADPELLYMTSGGNSRIPGVQRWFDMLMDEASPDNGHRRLALPDSFRQLAVAYGSVWVRDARLADVLPYSIRLRTADWILHTAQRNTNAELYAQASMRTIAVPPRQAVEFVLEAEVRDQWLPVERAVWSNPHDQTASCETAVDIQGGVLRFTYGIPSDGSRATMDLVL